jgi:DNA-binding NarL/FixJ family response regulator
MIRVLIADDHPIVREGVKKILTGDPGVKVLGEAGSGGEALEILHKETFDVVLLDISMPGMSGMDALKQIKAEKPSLPVLIYSVHPEEQYAVRALRAGASGYLTKDSVPDELLQAVRTAFSGKKYVSQSLAQILASELDAATDRLPHESLSDREYQVLLMIAGGKTVSEIAETIHLSVKTVSTYRSRILEKMRMKNNAELTYYTIQKKLID